MAVISCFSATFVIKNTDIEITKVAEKQEITAGSRNKYTVTIKNIGDYKARDVNVKDVLKGNAKYVKDSINIVSSKEESNTIKNIENIKKSIVWKDKNNNNESSLSLTIPIIEKGEIYNISYNVEYVDSEEESITTNTAIAKGTNTKEVKPKDTTNVKVTGVIKETTLDITKTSEKKETKDGDTNTYTINITNTGDYTARDVHLEEKLEGKASIVKTSVKVINSKGEDITKTLKKEDLVVTDNNIIVNVPNISSKETYKIVYDVKFDETEKDTVVVGKTKIKGSNTKEETITSNYDVKGTVKETNLEIEKTVDKSIIEAGDKNKYKVRLKNTGLYDARDIIIEDILKGDAKYIKDTIKVVDKDNNIIDKSKYSIEWIDKKTEKDENRFKIKFPIIEKGKDIIVTYNVQYADLEETQEIKNIIRAKGTNTNLAEPKEKEGVKVISKGVIKETNVDITKKAEKQEMPAGKKNKYTITITNTGDYSARNVHIEDIVSGNAKYLKDTISYDKNYNLKVEWDGKSPKVIIPVLKSKEEYILTYYMEYIDSEQDYDVTNTVKIKGDNIKEKEVKEKVLVKGVIKEILVSDQAAVDFAKPLFVIEI